MHACYHLRRLGCDSIRRAANLQQLGLALCKFVRRIRGYGRHRHATLSACCALGDNTGTKPVIAIHEPTRRPIQELSLLRKRGT